MSTVVETGRLLRGSGAQVLSIVNRVARGIVVVLLVTVMVVAMLSLVPGSVASTILGPGATPASVAELEDELGVNDPFWKQYSSWLVNALQGDLGTSPLTGQSVTTAIAERLPVTLEIAALGLIAALFVSVVLALLSVAFRGTWVDQTIGWIAMASLSVPAFIAGPILIYLFALQLGWLPVAGWVPLEESVWGNLQSVILPVIAISLVEMAAFQRLLRVDLLATLDEDYIAAARAKGLSEMRIMFRHALRPSSFSLMTIAGISLGRLIGGTVIVEQLFSLPGLGQLIAYSITSRDIIMVQGIVAFIAVVYVLINMFVDVGYGILDPRVRKAARA